MSRMTVAQAVSAIRATEKYAVIHDTLMSCTKEDMLHVKEAITGQSDFQTIYAKYTLRRFDKANLAHDIASFLHHFLVAEAFKAMTVAEKFATLKARGREYAMKMEHECTMEEQEEIYTMLGIENAPYHLNHDRWEMMMSKFEELNAQAETAQAKAIADETPAVENEPTLETKTNITLDEVYTELEGKTDRAEIEAILNRATTGTLKKYVNNEGGYKAYDGMSAWKRADYLNAALELTIENIEVEEIRAKIIHEEFVKSELEKISQTAEKYFASEMTANEVEAVMKEANVETLREFAAQRSIPIEDNEVHAGLVKIVMEDLVCEKLGVYDEEPTDGETYAELEEPTPLAPVIKGVKEATTANAIVNALMTCTPRDMLKVCTELTGIKHVMGGMLPKKHTAETVATVLMAHRLSLKIESMIEANAGKKDVESELRECPYVMHRWLMRWAGIKLEGEMPREVIVKRLASYYFSK